MEHQYFSPALEFFGARPRARRRDERIEYADRVPPDRDDDTAFEDDSINVEDDVLSLEDDALPVDDDEMTVE